LTADSIDVSGDGIFISEYGFSGGHENDHSDGQDGSESHPSEDEDEDVFLASDAEMGDGTGHAAGNEEFYADADEAQISGSDDGSLGEAGSDSEVETP
jgi:hypothetical protein